MRLHFPDRLLRIFVTGLLAALPLAATALIVAWGARLVYGWVGPDSAIGRLLRSIGLGVGSSEVAGYLIGVLVVLGLIFALGVLVETGLQRGLHRVIEALVGRIPVVRSVYDVIRRFVELVAPRSEAGQQGLQSMRPVWCHFGGPGGAAVLALLSTAEPVTLGDARYLGVIVPTAPVPVGGALIYVPEDWVRPADVGVEALTSIYVSMGVTSSQHLGTAPPAPPPAT
jgi:uncharacterized membrane protein